MKDDSDGIDLERAADLDIGVSVGDAVALKSALLHAIREGHFLSDEPEELAAKMVEAFKNIDNNVFARDEMESALRKKSQSI